METNVKREEVLEVHATGSAEVKAILEKLHGKAYFERPVEERVFTLDDVFKEASANPEEYPDFKNVTNRDVKAGNAMALWLLIVYCFNGCQDGDWTNGNQTKYFPWHECSAGGVWSFDGYDGWVTSTTAGARQGFLKREHVKLCCERFEEIYKTAYQIN